MNSRRAEVRSTFASGLNEPSGLAFNSAGDLFETDLGSGNIYEFTPGGTRSTFASGLSNPNGLAFNSAGNLFEADFASGNIYEFTPDGVQSTFASGLPDPAGLAFQGEPCPCLNPRLLDCWPLELLPFWDAAAVGIRKSFT